MYSKAELKLIRDNVVSYDKRSPAQTERYITEAKNRKLPGSIVPFMPLLDSSEALFEKIKNDPKAAKYSYFAFFPSTYPLVYSENKPPEVKYIPTEQHGEFGMRGYVLVFPTKERSVVIKPYQSSREAKIALKAAELGTGPMQFESIDGYISEEFINAPLFSQIQRNSMNDELFFGIGRRMGEMLSINHKAGIYYNDTNLSDDFGKSHVFVPSGKPAILFDYGVAIDVSNHPHYSREELIDYARTMPQFSFFFQLDINEQSVNKIIQDAQKWLNGSSKESVCKRDLDFVNSGIYLASGRLNYPLQRPFMEGFRWAYSF